MLSDSSLETDLTLSALDYIMHLHLQRRRITQSCQDSWNTSSYAMASDGEIKFVSLNAQV